jgi:hypothetical protein
MSNRRRWQRKVPSDAKEVWERIEELTEWAKLDN